MSTKSGAYAALLFACALFASGYVLVRAIDPQAGMGMFVTQSMFFCALTITLFGYKKPARKATRYDMAAMAFNGVGSPLALFLVLGGARVVTPSLASIIVNSNVLMIALLAWALGRKKFTKTQFLALTAGFAGIVWISLERGAIGGEARGVMYLLAGAVLVAAITVTIERAVVEIGAVAVTRWAYWIGFTTSLTAMIVSGQLKFHSFWQSGLAMITGGVSLGAPALLFYFGMSRLGSADAAAFKLLIPFFALIYGIVFLDQIPNLSSAIAGVLVIVSVAVYQFSGRADAGGLASARTPGVSQNVKP
ncbi:hypothetical protein MNBD_NITROSPINAE04-2497 [hydrothermal vent metagenome]|uniref:EamA domain-containing protein n=1 Tax=hydrothermal vent metagenome TaxID=652676 RepID=A0A3B1B9P3_9ZZZZ